MKEKKLAISLVTYNGMRYLPRCLESIASQSITCDELVIFDNHSSDQTVSFLRQTLKNAKLIESDVNRGFAVAHNDIIRGTTAEYILIMNQDLFMESSYCERLIDELDVNAQLGSISGMLVRVDSLDGVLGDGLLDGCGISIGPTHHASLTLQGTSSYSFTKTIMPLGLPATCTLYRRSALEDCAFDRDGVREYFDELFFMYKEDVDLSYRMRLRGWKCACIADVRCWHVRTVRSILLVNRPRNEIAYWSYRNHWYFLITTIPSSIWFFCGIPILLYECMKFVYVIVREPFALRAFFDILRVHKKLLFKRRSIQKRRTVSALDLMKHMIGSIRV